MDFKEVGDKIAEKVFWFTGKFEGVENKIFEQTGVKIPIGMIFGAIILILVTGFFVKLILGFVMNFLFNG